MKTRAIFTSTMICCLISCGDDSMGATGYGGKVIKVRNHCYSKIEILLPITSWNDSVVALNSYRDTLIQLKSFQDSLKMRKPYQTPIKVSVKGYSKYYPLVVSEEIFE